jgi:predicted nucleic acid-binding protein
LSAFLDTSVLVRYLVGDAREMAEEARRLIDGTAELWVTDGVLAETGYVLTSVYGVPRDAAVDALIGLVRRRNIRPYGLDKGTVLQALLLCRPSGRASFADAMLWAIARAADSRIVYSFDRRFPAEGIEVRHSVS